MRVHYIQIRGLQDSRISRERLSSKYISRRNKRHMDNEKRRNMLCLIRAKACKKCGGDLSLECDIYGVYIQCIQCGANWKKEDLLPSNTQNAVDSHPAEKAKTLAPTAH
jgi:hypothetical protein